MVAGLAGKSISVMFTQSFVNLAEHSGIHDGGQAEGKLREKMA